ncbi:MAG: RICIN domain-containing protein [Clostridiaceae bacterium]|nr:RICIN domain-containing protein [Clostridiaceae bacterium]
MKINSKKILSLIITIALTLSQLVIFSAQAKASVSYDYGSSNKVVTTTLNSVSASAVAWAQNTSYKVGDVVSYNGQNYKCIQAHTSLLGWEPSNVPALWAVTSEGGTTTGGSTGVGQIPGPKSPYFMIVNKNSGKALDLIGGDTSNAARINQWSYDYNSANQRWTILPAGDGHFKIISYVTGKAACIAGPSLNDGAQLHDYDYTGVGTDQQWDFVDAGNGWFKIKNVYSGKMLDVSGANTVNDGKVQQWSDNGGQGSQLWRLQPWGDYNIKADSGKYVCVQGKGSTNGSRIIQYDLETNPWFNWRFENVGDGLSKVSSLNALTRVLCVSGGSSTPGAYLHLWDYNNANTGDQKVKIVPQIDGKFKFYFAHDGQTWDVPGGQTGNNVEIDQYSNNNNSWQKFTLERTTAGGTGTGGGQGTDPVNNSFPTKVFAPYVDVMLWPTFSINDCYSKTGQKYYTLAFINSDGSGNPAWGGITKLADNFYGSEIDSIRSKGGDVIVSFGGANGTELATTNSDVNVLQAKYQSVIDKYKLTWIDFDIEGAAVSDTAAIGRRNKAIKGLQVANPKLKVAFCLPVLPSGLTAEGLNVLKNAKDNGVRIDAVNVMAMDFGDGPAPNPSGKMGDYAIQSANSTYNQCNNLGITTKIGVTPMIGVNDVQSEIFNQADARKLLSFAQSNNWVGLIAMWSANRDNGKGGALYQSSNISQTDFEFCNIFKAFVP